MNKPFNDKELIDKLKRSCIDSLNKNEKEELWHKIEKSIKHTHSRKQLSIISYLAIAVSICGIIILFNLFLQKNTQQELATTITKDSSLVGDSINSTVVLITADGKQKAFEGEEPSILAEDYIDSVEKQDLESVQKLTLIVPTGKKTYLILEDGTKLWVNSETKVSYPERFAPDQRIIEMEGEIFAEVAPDKNKPFIVRTKDFDIRVLGTSFNISAYKEDKTKNIVLVTGKVEVNSASSDKKIQLCPNSLLSLEGEDFKLKTGIDVYDYICWKDNLLSLNATSLENITAKLNRYYNSNIIIDNTLLSRKLSGKISLKNNIDETTKTLAISLNCKYKKQEDGSILIHP